MVSFSCHQMSLSRRQKPWQMNGVTVSTLVAPGALMMWARNGGDQSPGGKKESCQHNMNGPEYQHHGSLFEWICVCQLEYCCLFHLGSPSSASILAICK